MCLYDKLFSLGPFKSSTNFVDIIPQASGLKMSLNIDITEIEDPQNKCVDVSNLGRWGNGDVDYKLEDKSQIEYALFLIEQAFDMQIGEWFILLLCISGAICIINLEIDCTMNLMTTWLRYQKVCCLNKKNKMKKKKYAHNELFG